MRRVYADSVVFTQDAPETCIRVRGTDNMLYGSDSINVCGLNARRIFGLWI